MNRSITQMLCVLALMGCATTQPVPAELSAARMAYNRAASAPGAALAMVDIHTAQTALTEAEKAWTSKGTAEEVPRIADLAYIAQRKAELAETQGMAALARQQTAEAESALTQHRAAVTAREASELKVARQELLAAQDQTRIALERVKTLKASVKQEERGLVITIAGNVLFPLNGSELVPAARLQLSNIARALGATKGQKIAIEGYTDASGSAARNETLSRERAESVMSFLVGRGLTAADIRAVGLGPASPIASNTSAEGRATNRRVEIVIQAGGRSPQG